MVNKLLAVFFTLVPQRVTVTHPVMDVTYLWLGRKWKVRIK
jgi:hypothetical protein